MIPAGAVFRACRDVRFRVIDHEAVVLLQEAGETLVLNELGARILQLIDGASPLERVAEQLGEEFEVEPERLRSDLEEFVEKLLADRVIEAAEQR